MANADTTTSHKKKDFINPQLFWFENQGVFFFLLLEKFKLVIPN